MRKIMYTVLTLLFCLSFSLIAQHEFTVMAVKGNIEFKKTNNDSWAKLKTGAKLTPEAKIKVAKGSYLALLHKSGKSLEVKKDGEFTAKQLQSSLNSKDSKIASKLTNFVIDNLTESKNTGYDYREAMEATGAVERSLNAKNLNGPAAFVELKTPRKVNFTTNTANLIWKDVPNEKNYIFSITDRFDRVVFTREVTDNKFKISKDDLNLESDEYYLWHVACKSDRSIKSPDCAFSFLSNKQIEAINREYKQLVEELGDENSALNQIILGNFYEQHFLLNEAGKHYKKAVELEPSVEDYQNLYSQFLIRSNF